MAQADELARDIVVAWLSHNNVSFSLNDPEKIGEALGKIYTAVLQAVQGGFERHPPAPRGAHVIIEARPE
jgi:hypothetical protein